MTTIIDYIGMEGVKSIGPDSFILNLRFKTPTPGDIVDFGTAYEQNPYPFNATQFGRIEGKTSFCKADEIHVCVGGGSCYLGWDRQNQKPYVAISGGPFAVIPLRHLEPVYVLKNATFWNWGNNIPQAHGGCEYLIARPVFRWTGG